MSFDWQGYLTSAQEIVAKVNDFSDQEAIYRTATSRAYYAVFCLVRNYVRDIDGATFSGNDHKNLQNHFRNNSHSASRRKIGNQLRRLHQDRLKADYDDELDEKAMNKASKAITAAKKIVTGLTEIYAPEK